jgi:hypothetical protein
MNLIRGRSTLEIIIIVVLVSLVVVLSVGIYAGHNKLNKSKALISELQAMRMGIMLYKKISDTNPPSLDMLAKEVYASGGGRTHHYLLKVHRNASGAIVDPFGHPYVYLSNKGWVHSATKGFENW